MGTKEIWQLVSALLSPMRTQWERSYLQARKRSLSEPDHAGSLKSEAQILDCEKINFYYLNHPVYGILLQQYELMNTKTNAPHVAALTSKIEIESMIPG